MFPEAQLQPQVDTPGGCSDPHSEMGRPEEGALP